MKKKNNAFLNAFKFPASEIRNVDVRPFGTLLFFFFKCGPSKRVIEYGSSIEKMIKKVTRRKPRWNMCMFLDIIDSLQV